MTDHFKVQGRALLDNGYFIIPIRKGEKRPAIQGWQNSRLTKEDLDKFPGHGVGILCGQGDVPIIGIDVDISHPGVNRAVVNWCHQHLGVTCERIGAAPRVLLPYRAASSGWAKDYSVKFFDKTDPLKPNGNENLQQIEVLSLGQQFVAYHEHPDVGRDYEWTDLDGGLVSIPAVNLPVVTGEQIAALLAEVSRIVRATPGLEVKDSAERPSFKSNSDEEDLAALVQKVGKPIAEVAELMQYLENKSDHYDHWIAVGAALHHEYADTADADAALSLWKSYGAKSAKDKPGDYGYKWASFGRSTRAPTTLRWLLKVTHLAKKESEHAAARLAISNMRGLIDAAQDSTELGAKTAQDLRSQLQGVDPLVANEIVTAFRDKYKAFTGANLPVGQARSLLLPAVARKADATSKRALTEFGNAERMLDKYGDGLMYVPELDKWYIWTGVYWRPAHKVEIQHYAKSTIRELPKEADDHAQAQEEFFAFCSISQQARMVQNMVALASSDPRVVVPASELDRHTFFLGVKNGVVDLRTGQLLAPDKEHRITLQCGCEYHPASQAPLFKKVIMDIFSGNEAMVRYFLSLVGYSMMGNPKQDIMVIPYGQGSNGKSTLIYIMQQMMGTYARTADSASFVQSQIGANNAGGAREDLVRLRKSRWVSVSEPDEGAELREGSVKAMTGGDIITARGVHVRESIEIDPTWVIWMPTNHLPIIKGTDNGIWRRIERVPFNRDFDNDPLIQKDEALKEKLQEELPGILAIAVRYAMRYQAEGLVRPQEVVQARLEYRQQMDLLAEWLEECCEVSPNFKEDTQRLWTSWKNYAEARGNLYFIKSANALGRRMDQRFPAFKGTGGRRMRFGLQLKAGF